jgi:hypothetical protein
MAKINRRWLLFRVNSDVLAGLSNRSDDFRLPLVTDRCKVHLF